MNYEKHGDQAGPEQVLSSSGVVLFFFFNLENQAGAEDSIMPRNIYAKRLLQKHAHVNYILSQV